MLVDIIAGARPNFMKIATILRALNERQEPERLLEFRLIHTGQHYDPSMSGEFFAQLGIPEPDINMGIGSGTQAEQTGAIMVAYEKVLGERRSDLCVVVGDVTSTMACAITAQKLGVKVAHVEAGIRSGDWRMPEEINRLATDAVTNWFFTTSAFADDNLRRAGVSQDRIFFVGNTMIDTLLANQHRFREPDFWAANSLSNGNYLVLTLHRPSNVDDLTTFSKLINAIGEATGGMPVVFPVHPRTAKNLAKIPHLPASFILVDPQPYLEFNFLVQNAKAVITDSGGITEETTVMGVPCLTLRDTTERPETVTMGTNELIGTDPAAIGPALHRLFSGQWKKGRIPEKWDGRAGERIVAALQQLLTE